MFFCSLFIFLCYKINLTWIKIKRKGVFMKKIILLIALALGIFACDDGKKDNGGGGDNSGANGGSGAENLSNIKIGDTSPEQPFSIKSILSVPAMTSFGYQPINLTLAGMDEERDFESIIKFNVDDCMKYRQADGEYEGYYDLPQGVSCNFPYTLTPLLFARYTITYMLSSEAKSNVTDLKTEYGKIEFTASQDGITEPPVDIIYNLPNQLFPNQSSRSTSMFIQPNKKNDGDYIFVPYGFADFMNTEQDCSIGQDCFSVSSSSNSGCNIRFEKQTYKTPLGTMPFDAVIINVPQAGCWLDMNFRLGHAGAFNQENGLYLRPGNKLDTSVPLNVPIQRLVIKR